LKPPLKLRQGDSICHAADDATDQLRLGGFGFEARAVCVAFVLLLFFRIVLGLLLRLFMRLSR
jgi:hypothetical protein